MFLACLQGLKDRSDYCGVGQGRCQQKLNRGISSRVINPDICTVSTASLQILIYSQKEGDNTGMDTKPEAKFIVPDWGDKVNSGCRTGLPSYT
jgi:hypothetical protein